MSLQLIKCKVCGKTLSEPERIIGEPPRAHFARLIERLKKHFNSRINDEQLQIAKPHSEAFAAVLASMLTYQSLALTKPGLLFDGLPEDFLEDRERVRAGFAASLRKVTMTDEDLWPVAERVFDPNNGLMYASNPEAAHLILLDLRDRYEEIGAYAPTPLETQPAPQLVKP